MKILDASLRFINRLRRLRAPEPPPAPEEEIPTAPYPHCDSDVLHAPGECRFCDLYKDAQAYRKMLGINFTGHREPRLQMCPSEERRNLATINKWPGNRPDPQEG